jgi:thiol-disulfide isomerase/thioredoxin
MRAHEARMRTIRDILETEQIDVPLSNLMLTTMNGKPISASELRGSITVIDFWGTWCAGCIAELPSLEAVHKQYLKDSRVQFLLVNPEIEGDTPDKISNFLQHRSLSIPVALVADRLYFELSEKLQSDGLPLLIIIDRRGHVRFRKNGYISPDKTINGLRNQVDTLLAAP